MLTFISVSKREAAIQGAQLLFVDDKRKAILVEVSSVNSISNFTKAKRKFPPIPDGRTIVDVGGYLTSKKCDIKLKQQNPLLDFNQPGGFYSVSVEHISPDAVTARGLNGETITAQMNDVLFIQEK